MMPNKQRCLPDLSQVEAEGNDGNRESRNQKGKNNCAITSDNSVIEEAKIISRSIKDFQEKWDISFQAGFLNEHQKSFEKQLRNFLEKSLKEKYLGEANMLNSILFQPLLITPPSLSSDSTNPKSFDLLTEFERLQFSKDLQTEEKLVNFLSMIDEEVAQEVAAELYFLILKIWEYYISIRKPCLTSKQLKQAANLFANENFENFYANSSLGFITLTKLASEKKHEDYVVKKAFSEFLKFLTETVLLVVEEFFQNPYYETEGKRLREEVYDHESSSLPEGNMFFFTESQESYVSREQPSKMRKI